MSIASVIDRSPVAERNRETIQGLVDAYATQNIDALMALFSNDAVFRHLGYALKSLVR